MKVLIACEESQTVCIAFRELGHEAYSCDIQDCSGGHPEWHIKDDVLKVIDGYRKVVHANECFYEEWDKDRKNGICENCKILYSDCECPGPTEEYEYKQFNNVLYAKKYKWDLMIAHPPCTYLSFAGNAWFDIDKYKNKAIERIQKRKEAEIFFLKIYNCKIPKIAIENPRGSINKIIKHSQVIHPYYFGDKEKKITCLWLKNLPKLVHIKEDDLFDSATHTEEIKPKFIDRSGKKRYFTDLFGKTPDRIKLRSKTFPGIAKAMATQWGKI
jgi:hypothetical protein